MERVWLSRLGHHLNVIANPTRRCRGTFRADRCNDGVGHRSLSSCLYGGSDPARRHRKVQRVGVGRGGKQRPFSARLSINPILGSKGSSPYRYSVQEVESAINSDREARLGGPKKGDKVVVAMSGGVDSSVTALLLAQQDFDLRAVFMRNWSTLEEGDSFEPGSGGSSGCEWQEDWNDVQNVCRHLGGIPVEMIDLSKEYWVHVFEPALGDWETGTTPNPDVDCNREIKFGKLMDRLLGPPKSPSLETMTPSSEPKTWLATGHYAEVGWYVDPETGISRPKLMRAKDRSKDQTYYLSSVKEERLSSAHFPLAPFLKAEVREMAIKNQLPTARRKESMGICFVGNRGKRSGFAEGFLEDYIENKPGDIVDDRGNVVGRHRGLHSFTVGQSARIPGAKSKYLVARKERESNSIVVVQGKDHAMLNCVSLTVEKMNWIWSQPPSELSADSEEGPLDPSNELCREHPLQVTRGGEGGQASDHIDPVPIGSKGLRVKAQVRHRQDQVDCTIFNVVPSSSSTQGSRYRVEFDQSLGSVATGQVAAFWRGDWCLGSGVISHVETMWDRSNGLG
ncbi:hypothetical protein IE53DRAFT_386899 [Violaceomyces palustris]|uniref:Uncharacterized protein n=1 Tax=Violaceomyces palustris TaxID=1673888 RepID=A0ACD0NYB0_9BASI|nr:hypothetical protein IE53DRAFT_386899 [Violaceomyces palustris]